MSLKYEIRELIKLDLKKGKSINNIVKTYDVKKNCVREIQEELSSQSVAPSEIASLESDRQVDSQEVAITNTDNKIINNVDEKVQELINEHDILMQIIKEYKQKNMQTINKLVVELPIENDKKFRITQRVNDVIYKEFKDFADNNGQFTIKELLSQALKEFVDKYK